MYEFGASDVEAQRHALRYGVMFDALYDFVVPGDPEQLHTAEAVEAGSVATEKLRGMGMQDRQIMDVIRSVTIDVGLIKASPDSFEFIPTLSERASASNRSEWEQELFEITERERRQSAELRASRPIISRTQSFKETIRRNIVTGVAAMAVTGVTLMSLSGRGSRHD